MSQLPSRKSSDLVNLGSIQRRMKLYHQIVDEADFIASEAYDRHHDAVELVERAEQLIALSREVKRSIIRGEKPRIRVRADGSLVLSTPSYLEVSL